MLVTTSQKTQETMKWFSSWNPLRREEWGCDEGPDIHCVHTCVGKAREVRNTVSLLFSNQETAYGLDL